jgi:hypothetical protein
MPITAAQRSLAEQRQWAAARDRARQVRLVAGPEMGKSYTIEKRVADLLTNGATPGNARQSRAKKACSFGVKMGFCRKPAS